MVSNSDLDHSAGRTYTHQDVSVFGRIWPVLGVAAGLIVTVAWISLLAYPDSEADRIAMAGKIMPRIGSARQRRFDYRCRSAFELPLCGPRLAPVDIATARRSDHSAVNCLRSQS